MKTFNHSIVTVTTTVDGDAGAEFFGYEPEVRYHVRSLGRGRWRVECEDGYHWVARTAELQRYFRPHRYEDGYYSSGEPVLAYEEVRITRDTWWRW